MNPVIDQTCVRERKARGRLWVSCTTATWQRHWMSVRLGEKSWVCFGNVGFEVNLSLSGEEAGRLLDPSAKSLGAILPTWGKVGPKVDSGGPRRTSKRRPSLSWPREAWEDVCGCGWFVASVTGKSGTFFFPMASVFF